MTNAGTQLLALVLTLGVSQVALAQPAGGPPAPGPAEPAPGPAEPAPGPAEPAPGQPGPAQPAVQPPAGSTYVPPGQETVFRRTGFFGRATIGLGYQQMGETFEGDELKISGFSGAFFVSAGASILPGLALHFDLGAATIVDPDVEINGQTFETSDTSATTFGFGGGATYYMPSDIFVSGSVLFGTASLSSGDGDLAESGVGPILSLMAGREWWVAPEIGVGVAAQVLLGTFPDEDIDARINTAAFTVNVTATYN